MITILSSFLFIFPIVMCHTLRDTNGLILFSTGMGLSIANHSHRLHSIEYRRLLFNRIDRMFFHTFTPYLLIDAYLHNMSFFLLFFIFSLNTFFWLLIGPSSPENYNTLEKRLHALFHVVGISSFTFLRFYTIFHKVLIKH